MDESTFGLIELLLVFGLAIGLGLRELWLLKRDKRKTDRDQT